MNKYEVVTKIKELEMYNKNSFKSVVIMTLPTPIIGIIGMIILMNIDGIDFETKRMCMVPLFLVAIIPSIAFGLYKRNASKKFALTCPRCQTCIAGNDIKYVVVSDKCPYCGQLVVDA
jgi:hypothetical protein